MLCVPLCGAWTQAPEQSDRYIGGELIATYADETISYVSKQVISDISTANGTPEYYAVNDMQNACGAVVLVMLIARPAQYAPSTIRILASLVGLLTASGSDE